MFCGLRIRSEALEVKQNGHRERYWEHTCEQYAPSENLYTSLNHRAPEKVLKAASMLAYRDFLIIALIVNKRDVFQDNWIYIHDPRVKLGRIQKF